MPFANEHACRVKDPDQYVRFAREANRGSTPDFIYGIKRGGGSEIQAYRYPTARFTRAQASAHCRRHGGRFEAATGGNEEMATLTRSWCLIKANIGPTRLRTEDLDGRRYGVYSVVLLVEGVHAGSAGPFYYPAAVLSDNPAIWNGAPLPVQHPENFQGDPISANDPHVFEAHSVGWLFHVQWEARRNRLIGEAWIDLAKAADIAPELMSELGENGQLEVSTGLWFENDGVPGTWNGEQYQGTITSIQRDHLALLPGGVGACGIVDGCGLGVNQEGTVNERYGLSKIIAQAIGEMEKHSKLRAALDAMDGNGLLHYLEDVKDGRVIYRVVNMAEARVPVAAKYYSRGFTIDENTGRAVLANDEYEVRISERDYQRVAQAAETGNASDDCGCDNKERSIEMPKKEDLVAALIANDGTPFTAACKDKLMAFGEDVLEKLLPTANDGGDGEGDAGEEDPPETPPADDKETPPATPPEPTPAVEPGVKVQARPPQPQSAEQVIAQCKNPEIQATLWHGLQEVRRQRAQKTTAILKATNTYTEKELKAMTEPAFQKVWNLVNSLTPQPSYEGAEGGLQLVPDANEVPEPPDPYANSRDAYNKAAR